MHTLVAAIAGLRKWATSQIEAEAQVVARWCLSVQAGKLRRELALTFCSAAVPTTVAALVAALVAAFGLDGAVRRACA